MRSKKGMETVFSTLAVIALVLIVLITVVFIFSNVSSNANDTQNQVYDDLGNKAQDCIQNPTACSGITNTQDDDTG